MSYELSATELSNLRDRLYSRRSKLALIILDISYGSFQCSTGCIGLLAAVAQLSKQISAFVSSVRDARRDMDAVSRELISLTLCLEMLRDDLTRIAYSDGFRANLLAVVKNCDTVTKDMTTLLDRLSSQHSTRRVQWTVAGRDDMSKLRSSLESHKSALEIALDITSL